MDKKSNSHYSIALAPPFWAHVIMQAPKSFKVDPLPNLERKGGVELKLQGMWVLFVYVLS